MVPLPDMVIYILGRWLAYQASRHPGIQKSFLTKPFKQNMAEQTNQPIPISQDDKSSDVVVPVLDGVLNRFTAKNLLDWTDHLTSINNMQRSLSDITKDLAVAVEMMLCYAGHSKYSKDTPQRQAGCVFGNLTICHDVVSHLLCWIQALCRRADMRQFMAASMEINDALHLLNSMDDMLLAQPQSHIIQQCLACMAGTRKKSGVQVASNMPIMSAASILATLVGNSAVTIRSDSTARQAANTKRKVAECSNHGSGSSGSGGSKESRGGGSKESSSTDDSSVDKLQCQACDQSDQQASKVTKSNKVKSNAVDLALKDVGRNGKTFTTCTVADWLENHRFGALWKARAGMVKYIRRMLTSIKTVAIKHDTGKQGSDKQFTLC